MCSDVCISDERLQYAGTSPVLPADYSYNLSGLGTEKGRRAAFSIAAETRAASPCALALNRSSVVGREPKPRWPVVIVIQEYFFERSAGRRETIS